jgi:hypothetical protein
LQQAYTDAFQVRNFASIRRRNLPSATTSISAAGEHNLLMVWPINLPDKYLDFTRNTICSFQKTQSFYVFARFYCQEDCNTPLFGQRW